jgi:hypothetical protein
MLDRSAQAVARGAARCASQVLGLGAGPLPSAPRPSLRFTKAGSAATLSQQEKSSSEDVKQRLYPSRGYTYGEFGQLADNFAAGAPPPTYI